MIIYIVLLLALLFGLVLPKKMQARYSFAIFMVMMLVCGLRSEIVGTDTERYFQFFTGSQTNDRYGFFYEAIRDINLYFGGSPSVALTFIAMLTYIPLFYILKKNSPILILSIIIYTISLSQFYIETFNIARQSLAIVFVLLAVCIFVEKQPGRNRTLSVIICLLLALIAHKMTIIAWPFFFFSKKRLGIITVIVIISISIAIGLSNVLEDVYTFLNLLQKYDDADYLSVYANSDLESELNVIGTLTRLIPLSILCILLYPKDAEGKTVVLYNFFFFGVVIINILMRMSLCVRFASPLTIVELILVPCIYKQGRKFQKLGISFFIAYECAYYIYSLYSLMSMTDLNPPVPYKCVL